MEEVSDDQYIGNERNSYFSTCKGYKSISDQIEILYSYWPNLNPAADLLRYYRVRYQTLQFPKWVKGHLAIIRPGFFSNKYGEELEEILKILARDRNGKFHNYCEGQLGPEYLRQLAETKKAFQRLELEQKGNILIISVQSGSHYAGLSAHCAHRMFVANEFGLGAFIAGIMLITHPERLQCLDDLSVDCAGDEYALAADGQFDYVPSFRFDVDGLEFIPHHINYGNDLGYDQFDDDRYEAWSFPDPDDECCSSASFFLPPASPWL